MWRLICIDGLYKGHSFDLSTDKITIGRSKSCNISLSEESSLAEQQGELVMINGDYVYENLVPNSSSDLTNRMITLRHGETVNFGSSLFKIEDLSAGNTYKQPKYKYESKELQIKHNQVDSTTNNSSTNPFNILWIIATIIIIFATTYTIIHFQHIAKVKVEQKEQQIQNIAKVKAEQEKEQQIAEDAITSLKAINSSLKVGLNLQNYSAKLADAQIKIDTYIEKYPGTELVRRLSEIQQYYVDAGDLWEYSVNNKYGIIIEGGELFSRCIERYGNILDIGVLDDGREYIYVDTNRNILWETASLKINELKSTTD